MKSRYTLLFSLFVLPFALRGTAQKDASELDADRKPVLVTTGTVFIKNATILTPDKKPFVGSVFVRQGKIKDIGANLTPPADVPVLDATGKFLTPGIVDAHSHMASDATNEGTDSITAEVRIHDVLNADALGIYQATASGQTAALVLHGSANAIGGQSVVIKLKWKQRAEDLIVPDAPRIVKFALGENVKRSNRFPGESADTRFPATRLGVEAVYRRAFAAAKQYKAEWDRWNQQPQHVPTAVPPRKDLRLEALSDILEGKIWVHCHSYRADEMLMMLRLAKEFGFHLTLQHALEAYKIAPEIAAQKVGVSTFADRWFYKIEAFDAIPYNTALCVRAGIVTSVNSDTSDGLTQLNLEAAKGIKYGGLTENEALKTITLWPAMQLGIAHRTGSLEVGKDGDLALWDGHPFSAYSRCAFTIVEGVVVFQRRDAFGVNGKSTLVNTLPVRHVEPSELPALALAPAYVIQNATIHPVSGPDILNGAIAINNGKIEAVGKQVAFPKNAVVINGKGLHVYPGLIDGGSVLGLDEIDAVNATKDESESGDFQPDLVALTGVQPASVHIGVTRFSGITTAFVRPVGGVIGGQGSLVNLAGWTTAEMGLRERAALRVTFPDGDGVPEFARQFLPEEEIERRTAQQKERAQKIRDYFARAKRYATSRGDASLSPVFDAGMEAMIPYMTGKLPVVFQVNTARGIKKAVAFAEEFGLHLIVSGGRESWRVAELLATKKIPVLYSPDNNPFNEYEPYDAVFAAPGILHRAGVKVAFQSDNLEIARNLPFQVGMCGAFGLPPDAALKAVTQTSAEILGVGDLIGTLEAGKLGNVIVTDGDPLDILTSVHYVFIGGKPVRQESKHTTLYKTYRERLNRR